MKGSSRNVPPKAPAMIEALRGLGYTTADAVSDLIDNSIFAQATRVDILFDWNGLASTISLLDNGTGMDDAELEHAMRLGDRNPIDKREPNDLGRFGLGLKTASFSQCRRLTVATSKSGAVHCLRWDLDVLAASPDGSWLLLEGCAPGSEHLLSQLSSNGTLVIWEVLDRIVTPGFTQQDFLDLIDRVEQHLAMTFHRYLTGPSPRLTIAINNRPVAPWDPFLSGHSATWSSPAERLATDVGFVDVQCYVLPHKDWLADYEYKSGGGADGWTAQQGFYVYRNQRMLVAGSWLGLGSGKPWTKEEVYRLARIRLDLPNTADAEWKIDIRKAIARPPANLKTRLTRLAEDTRERARRVFAHRGQVIQAANNSPVTQAWHAEHFREGLRYRIERNHAAIKSVLEEAGPLRPQVETMLRIIEETVPIQRIWLDTIEQKETPRVGFAGAAPEEIFSVLQVLYKNLVVLKGYSATHARETLLSTDPFHRYPHLVRALPDNPEGTS